MYDEPPGQHLNDGLALHVLHVATQQLCEVITEQTRTPAQMRDRAAALAHLTDDLSHTVRAFAPFRDKGLLQAVHYETLARVRILMDQVCDRLEAGRGD